MAWTIEFDAKVHKTLAKLDKAAAKRILHYLQHQVATRDDPRSLGKELKGNLGNLWRYRVGDYRIICHLEDDKMLVLVLRVGHRKNIYG